MFRDELIDTAAADAEAQVHEDYSVIRRVGERWAYMGAKRCMDAWRGWATKRRADRERMAREDACRAKLAQENAWAQQELIEAEKAKWVPHTDPFSEKVSKAQCGMSDLLVRCPC